MHTCYHWLDFSVKWHEGILAEFVVAGVFLHSFKKLSFPLSISRQFRDIRCLLESYFDHCKMFLK